MDGEWTEALHNEPPRGRDESLRRLLRLGASALTSAELVELVTGVDDASRVEGMLRDGLRALLMESPESLVDYHLLDAEQAARLLASAELARRLHLLPDERLKLATPVAIYEWAKVRLLASRREEFHVLCLNARNTLLRHVRVAEGSADQCQVDPREALAPAVACRATGIVLVHNHPAGDPEPSVHDVALTRHLREAARYLCIKLLDHVVVGERGYVSLVARGLLGHDERALVARLQSP